VMEAWPHLPEPIKIAMVAMIQASTTKRLCRR
jgi:hypothetical protein